MTTAVFKARRATMEDLSGLTALWQLMRFPAEELAKRVTDFQVVVDGAGNLIGAAALEMNGRQGRLHSEGFLDFAHAEHSRPILWDRITALANNHGLCNIWTQEQAPFWKQGGFLEPSAELLPKLPESWGRLPGRWLVLKLREDVDAALNVDK